MSRINLSPEEALQMLRQIDDDASGMESSSGSEESDDCLEYVPSAGESSSSPDSLEDEPSAPRKRCRTDDAGDAAYAGKDGTMWVKNPAHQGRSNSANVFRVPKGPPAHVKQLTTEAEHFLLFLPPSMLKKIIDCTTAEYKRATGEDNDLCLSMEELMAFIGLTVARGVLCGRGEPLHAFWSQDYGRDLFRQSMTRTRYKEILRHIRFDDKATRSARKDKDKFCLIRDVWKSFLTQCQTHFHPSCYLTVDEQLFPTKARCPFTQYMPNKPGKFGIKFWMLCDSDSSYILNAEPYLGRHFEENRGQMQLGEFVVMNLMQPYLNKGHNVTTDNFFTSKRLAENLAKEKTTIIGTVRGNRKELPPAFTEKRRKVHSVLQGYDSGSRALLTSYQAKKTKVVNILSTMHAVENNVCTDGTAKPQVVGFYNKTKGGVDTADQMCRHFSCKPGSRRWPLHVFCNMLDMIGVNSFVLWSQKQKVQRRVFLLHVVKDLVKPLMSLGDVPRAVPAVVGPAGATGASGARRKCRKCKKNMTKAVCGKCKEPVCGSCKSDLCKSCCQNLR